MYTLIVKGPRRATLAVHHLDNEPEMRELQAIYLLLGHPAEMLHVEVRQVEEAA